MEDVFQVISPSEDEEDPWSSNGERASFRILAPLRPMTEFPAPESASLPPARLPAVSAASAVSAISKDAFVAPPA